MEHLTRLIIIPCQLEREECDVTAPHPLLASDTTRGVSHITPTRWRHQRRTYLCGQDLSPLLEIVTFAKI